MPMLPRLDTESRKMMTYTGLASGGCAFLSMIPAVPAPVWLQFALAVASSLCVGVARVAPSDKEPPKPLESAADAVRRSEGGWIGVAILTALAALSACLLAASVLMGCAASPDYQLRDAQARVEASEDRLDVALSVTLCARETCADVRAFYLWTEGEHVVCFEVPGLVPVQCIPVTPQEEESHDHLE